MQAIQKVLQRFISGDNGVLGVLGVVFVILVGGQVCRGDLATSGLVLHLDAGNSGNSAAFNWEPITGPVGGGIVAGLSGQDKPELRYESFESGYLWYYNFAADAYGRCGHIFDLGHDIDFDYDDDFTIELWLKVETKCPAEDNTGRAILLSDGSIGNGYRFNIRHSDPDRWYLEMVVRDSIGDNITTFRRTSSSIAYDSNWHQVAVVYNGSSGLAPYISLYRDGGNVGAGTASGGEGFDYNDTDDIDFLQNGHGAIGSTYLEGMYPFAGGISVVRVYNRMLASWEVSGNYNWGLTEKLGTPTFSTIVTNGLVLNLDAAFPGATRHDNWEALWGGDFNGGVFNTIGNGECPVIGSDAHPDNGSNYVCFYNFSPASNLNSGNAEEFGTDINFDYDDDFTIEAWVRVAQKGPESAGRGIIFSDQNNGDGYRFGGRHDADQNKWYLEMIMRDNTGADDTEKTQFSCWGSPRYSYSNSQWYHVSVVYDGATNSAPTIDFYVDANSISDSGTSGGVNYSYADLDFVTEGHGAVGGRHTSLWYPFDGDISAVRVYNRTLSHDDIRRNYELGMVQMETGPANEVAAVENLKLSMDAAYPGADGTYAWSPIVGPCQGGQLSSIGQGDYPELAGDAAGSDYNWYYRVEPLDEGDCGQVANLKAGIDYDYNDDFSIEAWIRVPQTSPEAAGRGIIIGNQDSFGSGYRFGVRHDSGQNKWYLEMIMRDNYGSDDTEKTQFNCWGSSRYSYSGSQWHHVCVVYEGNLFAAPTIDFYVDGSIISDTGVAGGVNYNYTDLDFVTSGWGSIGSSYQNGDYPFHGDISLVRVYDGILSSAEIAWNCNIGMTAVDSQPVVDAPAWSNMHVIFDNDTTNLLTCNSWYRQPSHYLTPYVVQGSIDELADTGIDVHLACPGLGRVPFWPSRTLPLEKHYDWFLNHYGVIAGGQFTDYVFMGQDVLGEMLAHSKENNLGAFVSYRLNDQHNLDAVDDNPVSGGDSGTICQFYYDNPSYRLGPDLTRVDQRVQNWAYPEVRDFIFERVEEICENYDLEGLQLDLLRHASYFDLNSTDSNQRKAIMTDFIKRVRQLLTRTTQPGKHRYLGVRVPAFDDTYDRLGINLEDMIDGGVDFINFSNFFHTVQQNELSTLLGSVPDHIKTYYEVTNTISWIPPVDTTPRHFRLCTEQMLVTTAHLAYTAGINGISAFNFQYYRPPTEDGTGGYEPPYEVFTILADAEQCAEYENQHYVIADVYDYPTGWVNQLPNVYTQNESVDFDLPMAEPDGGWSGNWRMRIMADSDISGSTWEAKFNGILLSTNADVSEPYDGDYDPQWDSSNMYKAFTLSSDDVVNGNNTVTVKLTSAGPVNLVYLDLFRIPDQQDLNEDGKIDTNDLEVMACYWLNTDSGLAADIDQSGRVDLKDFAPLAKALSPN